MKAISTVYSRDLFWRFYVPNSDEVLRWTGYGDSYWWKNVAITDDFQVKTTKDGRKFRLIPDSNEVREEVPYQVPS